MESDFTPQQALAEAERASVSPWIDYPPTPLWFFPAFGAWAAAMLLTFAYLDDLWRVGAALALVGLEGWCIWWMKRQRGTWPQVTKPPAEFKRAIRAYMVGAALLVLAVVAVLAFVSGALAAVIAFVGVTAGMYWYEQAYARAAAATRERVGTVS